MIGKLASQDHSIPVAIAEQSNQGTRIYMHRDTLADFGPTQLHEHASGMHRKSCNRLALCSRREFPCVPACPFLRSGQSAYGIDLPATLPCPPGVHLPCIAPVFAYVTHACVTVCGCDLKHLKGCVVCGCNFQVGRASACRLDRPPKPGSREQLQDGLVWIGPGWFGCVRGRRSERKRQHVPPLSRPCAAQCPLRPQLVPQSPEPLDPSGSCAVRGVEGRERPLLHHALPADGRALLAVDLVVAPHLHASIGASYAGASPRKCPRVR